MAHSASSNTALNDPSSPAGDCIDVIIIGGGLSGGLCALALADAGFDCALLDAAPRGDTPNQQQAPTGGDPRTTAISYANARLLKRLGLWDTLAADAQPINDILVTDGQAQDSFRSGGASSAFMHFDSRALEPSTPLGWIIENAALHRAINDALKAASITVKAPCRVMRTHRNGGHATAHLDDGTTLSASLLIAADGKASPRRREAGIRTHQWSYGQSAIVTTVAHQRDHEGVAQEFFLPGGPFAILPMTKGRSSLVWTEKTAAARAYVAKAPSEQLAAIKNRFGPYLGDVTLETPCASYPLGLVLAENYISQRLVLIGDAAHAIHPIAGQGYNLGVKDIAALVDVLQEAAQTGLDIGAFDILERYQRWRRFDVTSMALGTDLLNRLFSNDHPALRLARRTGLGAIGAVSPMRKFFMQQAGGDIGKLPSLIARD